MHDKDAAAAAAAKPKQKERRTYSRHGLTTLKVRVMVRGLASIDLRTSAAQALLGWRRQLVTDLGGEGNLSAQRLALIDLAVRTRLFVDHLDSYLLGQESLINKRKKSLDPSPARAAGAGRLAGKIAWATKAGKAGEADAEPGGIHLLLREGSRVNILQALEDANLFRPWFNDANWDAWKAFLAVLSGLPMSEAQLACYRAHTERQNAPANAFRESWVVVGRRGGKSLVAALIATYLACFRDYRNVLAPGETGVVMILASDRRQSRVAFNYVSTFLELPMLARMVHSRLKESIELTNNIKIEIHTSSFRSVRGYTIVAAICDEIAFWPNEDSSNPDIETVNALRPAMTTALNALLLGISSPYARRGVLWQMYKSHYAQDSSDVLVWQGDTRSMNPSVSESLIQAAYERDEASAKAEYGAEFRSDVESFLSAEVVEGCVIPHRNELPPTSEASYVAFCDPSGGSSDSFTLAIGHRQKEVAVLDAIREVRPPFSPENVVAEFSKLLATYRVSVVHGDAYAGAWPKEQFAKRGISYKTSEQNRSELYLELLPAIMSGKVELLDSKRLVAQHSNLERRTARSGRDSVDHAPGSHDDVANAAAGSLTLALRKRVSRWLLLMEYYRTQVIKGRMPYEPSVFENPGEYQRLRAEYQQELANPNVCENPQTGEKLRWDGRRWVDYWTGIPYSAQ